MNHLKCQHFSLSELIIIWSTLNLFLNSWQTTWLWQAPIIAITAVKRGKFDADTYTPQRGRSQDFGPWQRDLWLKGFGQSVRHCARTSSSSTSNSEMYLGLTLSYWKGKQGKEKLQSIATNSKIPPCYSVKISIYFSPKAGINTSRQRLLAVCCVTQNQHHWPVPACLSNHLNRIQ